MYTFGQKLKSDRHFIDHMKHEVPIQVYLETAHKDIGFARSLNQYFVKINDTYYNRSQYEFISRPGF